MIRHKDFSTEVDVVRNCGKLDANLYEVYKKMMMIFGFPYTSASEHQIVKILVSIPHNYTLIMMSNQFK